MSRVANRSIQLMAAAIMLLFFFACGGLGLAQGQRDVPYWLFVVFFGALGAFSLWMALSGRSTMTLTQEGFTVKSPLTTMSYRWEDFEAFGWGTANRVPAVFAKFASTYTGKKPVGSSMSKYLADGFEMYFPALYDMTAEQQAALFTAWRARRLGLPVI
jgi:hypothetical protein